MAKAVKKAAAKKASPVKKVAKKIAKKVAVKKSGSEKSETGIKYSDKSGGQPELIPIFDGIKKLMLPYAKGNIKVRGGTGGQMVLVSEKPVVINGKARDEYWFGAIIIQRGYVGFYFMPVHDAAEKKEVFKPELLKYLKGKSCFHIKKEDAEIFKQIKEALAKGYDKCKEKGWI
jgi:hypothetical protein